MLKGMISIGAGVTLLVGLSMSNEFRALAGMASDAAGSAYLQVVPTSADVPAVLSYTCRIADMVALGGFCGM